MSPQTPTPTLTAPAARRLLNSALHHKIPKSTFYRMIADGRITTFRVGHKILVTNQHLDDFLQRCKRGERY